jgi:glycosyltransferase involved in cell wall biosynthesis
MNILLATHHFPPKYKAGAEQYAYRIARNMMERGHQVTVVCIEAIHNGSREPVHDLAIYDGIPVYRLSLELFKENEPLRLTYDNPYLGAWFRKYLTDHRPDVLHVNSGYLLTASVPQAAYQTGIPVVITLHDYWFLCPRVTLIQANGRLCYEPVEPARCAWCLLETKRRFREPDILTGGRLGDVVVDLSKHEAFSRLTGLTSPISAIEERREFLKEVMGKADAVVYPSNFMKSKVEDYGFPTHNLYHLPYGLEVTETGRDGNQEMTKRLRFGYLGQLSRHKGVHTIIKAYLEAGFRTEDAELVIFGDLTREPAYVEQLRLLSGDNPAINFAGPYKNQEVGKVLSSIDILIAPSEWYENWPTVILEAFAHNVPVIGANMGGIPEMICDGENGFLFEPGDVHDLAHKMVRILKEPSLLASFKTAINPVKSINQEIIELEGIYQSIAVRKQSLMQVSELVNR